MMVLVLSALIGAAPFDWGRLPGELDRTEVPGEMSSGGKRVHMELRRCKARPEDILSWTLHRFVAAGLYVAPPGRQVQGPGPSLTAVDPTTRVSYSVSVIQQSDGVVQVILGDADHGKNTQLSEGDWPPAYPEVKGAMRSNVEGARSLSFTTRDPRARVEAWYQQTLSAQGFELSSPGVWEKGAERVRLELKADGANLAGMVWAESGLAPTRPAEGARP